MSVIEAQRTLDVLKAETARTQYEQSLANRGSGKIDKQAFMNLLLAQLKNQDPTNPVDDAEFVSQQAMFAQLEKLDDINNTLQQGNLISQGSSMIGKAVDFKLEDGDIFTGIIDSVSIGDNNIGLNVGDRTFTMDQVSRIFSPGE